MPYIASGKPPPACLTVGLLLLFPFAAKRHSPIGPGSIRYGDASPYDENQPDFRRKLGNLEQAPGWPASLLGFLIPEPRSPHPSFHNELIAAFPDEPATVPR